MDTEPDSIPEQLETADEDETERLHADDDPEVELELVEIEGY